MKGYARINTVEVSKPTGTGKNTSSERINRRTGESRLLEYEKHLQKCEIEFVEDIDGDFTVIRWGKYVDDELFDREVRHATW